MLRRKITEMCGYTSQGIFHEGLLQIQQILYQGMGSLGVESWTHAGRAKVREVKTTSRACSLFPPRTTLTYFAYEEYSICIYYQQYAQNILCILLQSIHTTSRVVLEYGYYVLRARRVYTSSYIYYIKYEIVYAYYSRILL